MSIRENWVETLKQESILITGGAGFLGSRIVQLFSDYGFNIEIFKGQIARQKTVYITRSVITDLTIETQVSSLFSMLNPSVVIHLAAAVGGIGINQKTPGDFFYKNAMMGLLTQEYARRTGCKKFASST